jgi:hypothetical protein
MRKRSKPPVSSAPNVTTPAPLPTPTALPPTPPMWAPDPYRRFQLRYWDGSAWTAQVSSWWRQEIDGEFVVDAPVPTFDDDWDGPWGSQEEVK